MTARCLASALVLLLAGCHSDFSVTVDRALTPSSPDTPGFVTGERRPLAVLATESGQRMQFIENELVLVGLDAAAREALIERSGASVVRELLASTHGLEGLGDVVLIRVDPSKLSASEVEDDLGAIARAANRRPLGHFRVSSENGLRTLALAAQQARAGARVALNVQGESTGLPTSTTEGINLPAGLSRDAFSWDHLKTGGDLDYGVTGAWALLHRAGKLGFRIKIALIDGGFAGNAEAARTRGFTITVLGDEPFGTESPNTCTGGATCRWHGQSVLSACCGLVDDGFGSAGTAGLIAEPIVVRTYVETFSIVEALVIARGAGARIINASMGIALPDIVEWVALPIDLTVGVLRASGTLVFAAAGNEGADVDSHDACFADICWEDTYRVPCESPGVICVGGMATSVARHPRSNYGAEDVRLYAPYTVLVGPDPEYPGNTARWENGTSLSSPWTAGVAALLWAADPSFTSDEVGEHIRAYVHTESRSGLRWVAARNGVLGALGATGEAHILAPANGASVEWGLPVNLDGHLVLETFWPRAASCAVRWSTDTSGTLVERTVTMPTSRLNLPSELVLHDTTTALARGSQTLRLEATCSTAEASVTLSDSQFLVVHNTPPVVRIEAPVDGATSCAGQAVLLRGFATDVNEPTGMEASQYEWRSSLDGVLGTGSSLTTTALRVGAHTLLLRVTDRGGLVSQASVRFTVLGASHPTCSDTPPTAHITSPADGAWFGATAREPNDGEWYRDIDVVGVGTDRETPASALTYRWTSDREGLLGSGASRRVRLHTVGGVTTTHTLTLQVTDGDGNSASDHVHVTVEVIY